MKDFEKVLKQRKAARKFDILLCFIASGVILFMIWLGASWIEVIQHNDAYFRDGVSTDYSWWNYFQLFF